MTEEQARELLLNNYLYYGVMMVKMGDADGMVSGACHSTADTLRPCLQILKTKPGDKTCIRILPDGCSGLRYGGERKHLFLVTQDWSRIRIRRSWLTSLFLPQSHSVH